MFFLFNLTKYRHFYSYIFIYIFYIFCLTLKLLKYDYIFPFESYFDEKFSVKKLSIKDSDIPFILSKCFDVEHLELIDSALNIQCIPYLFQNKNRNNIKKIVFHDYRQKHVDDDNDDDDDVLLNQNGLFLKEFNNINVNGNGIKFESVECEGNLNLTKYFLYNVLKLSFNSLQSLHIEELSLLNINKYENIYGDMILYQLKELCFTCTVDEDIKDDFVLNSNIKYFQTPDLKRLNIEITSFTDNVIDDNNNNNDNKQNGLNINRYLKIFGIKQLKYLGINIEQNIDDNQYVLLNCLCGLMDFITNKKQFCFPDIIKLNINAEWFGEINFECLVQGIKNLLYMVDKNNNNNLIKLFVLSIGDLYFDINNNLINDLRINIFNHLNNKNDNKWKIMEQIELFGNNTAKIKYKNILHENHLNWISKCHCCERPASI